MQPLALKTYRLEKKRPVTSKQLLAGEIYEHFGKRLPFPQIIGIISRKGERGVREAFSETIKGNGKDKLALFLWACKQQKISFEEI